MYSVPAQIREGRFDRKKLGVRALSPKLL